MCELVDPPAGYDLSIRELQSNNLQDSHGKAGASETLSRSLDGIDSVKIMRGARERGANPGQS